MRQALRREESYRQQAAMYPLKIESISQETYTVMSRGHHDIHDFMREVRLRYDWPLGEPEHLWFRAVPSNEYDGTMFVEARPHSRGAFPVTYASEAYGEDSYEQLFQTLHSSSQHP